jgi:hypothetical protein
MSDVPFESAGVSTVNLARTAVLGLNIVLWVGFVVMAQRFLA